MFKNKVDARFEVKNGQERKIFFPERCGQKKEKDVWNRRTIMIVVCGTIVLQYKGYDIDSNYTRSRVVVVLVRRPTNSHHHGE